VQNFIEMNKLWVRIQPPENSTPDLQQNMEKDRSDLRLLVGGNLSRISQLEGVTLELYSEVFLVFFDIVHSIPFYRTPTLPVAFCIS
jgi:vacuolar protein sorting-associated protein 35